MARAPDQRAEEARKLFDSGMKLIEISEKLGVPEGTVRSWKNRYKWNNATLQEKKVVSLVIKMPRDTAVQDHREIRMQLRQESLKLSFLIPWM